MTKVQEIAVYMKREGQKPDGKFANAQPLEERLVYAAELSEGEGSPRRLFGRTLSALAKNIVLNLGQGDGFRLTKRDANGGDTLVIDDSELVALDHAIAHQLKQKGKSGR